MYMLTVDLTGRMHTRTMHFRASSWYRLGNSDKPTALSGVDEYSPGQSIGALSHSLQNHSPRRNDHPKI